MGPSLWLWRVQRLSPLRGSAFCGARSQGLRPGLMNSAPSGLVWWCSRQRRRPWSRGLHGSRSAWVAVCMGRGLHGSRSAWVAICMGRDLHGPRSAWGRDLHGVAICMGRDLHGARSAWVAICMGSRSAWGAFRIGARFASGVLHRLWSRSGGRLWYRVQMRGVRG
jgi:hypothetical protein